MKIYGQDYEFLLTVSASAKIADLCPDHDLSRLGEVMSGPYSEIMVAAATIVVAMAEGYDRNARRSGCEVTHEPLTVDALLDLPAPEFKAIQMAAMEAFRADIKPTVEVAPGKKKEKAE